MPYVAIPTAMAEIQSVIDAQDEIGWMNMVEGCVAHQWEEIQDKYYKAIGSRRSGCHWMVAIIQKMWDIA
jgi:hypothetical protein